VIRPAAPERWTYTIACGLVAAFVAVGTVANVIQGALRDAVLLALFAAWLAGLAALRWVRFVAATPEGLVYRNWLWVRLLPWEQIEAFAVRRLYQRGGGWVVVARRASGGPVTLRATGRGGRRPDGLGAGIARQLGVDLEASRP